jgi:hypothetical protein
MIAIDDNFGRAVGLHVRLAGGKYRKQSTDNFTVTQVAKKESEK